MTDRSFHNQVHFVLSVIIKINVNLWNSMALSCIFCILANHNLPLINLLETFAPFKSNCCSWKTSILVLHPLFNLYPISTNIQPSSSVIINFSWAEFTDGFQGVSKLPKRELGCVWGGTTQFLLLLKGVHNSTKNHCSSSLQLSWFKSTYSRKKPHN